MGLTFLEIEVGNPANPAVTEKLDFVVDSGAIYSVVPISVLERLGIRPLAEQEFRLANGAKVRRKKGGALFKYGERLGVADVIFGEEGDSVLLGHSPWKPSVCPWIRCAEKSHHYRCCLGFFRRKRRSEPDASNWNQIRLS